MDGASYLCANCASISLPALIDAIPRPSRPRGGGSGIPNFFEYSIPQPLVFPEIEDGNNACDLCNLILKQRNAGKPSSNAASLELAALCPPSEHSHESAYCRETRTLDLFAEPQPQWHNLKEGEKRVNVLEPVTERSGSKFKDEKYEIHSPWQINCAADAGSPAAKHITRRPLHEQGSDASLKGLLQLLSECDSDHVRCKLGVDAKSLDDPPPLPTRVIDVGTDQQPPRLIISNGRKARYTTLSHCWGDQRWVATTSETLPMMLDSFDCNAIPKTYRDAIMCTRKLNVQYLWIDSFCIIQDDTNDWLAEAARMGDIYENAYCNIAVSSADSGDLGFLCGRREEPTFVRVPGKADSDQYFYFTNQQDSNFDSQVRRGQLNTRGWVMQERVLSRRTIHFSVDMWYFECGEHTISEDGWQHEIKGIKRDITPSLRASLEDATMAIGKIFHFDSVDNSSKDDKGVPTPPTEVLWAQLLRVYSRCELTFWSDKLHALQGLANRFRGLTAGDHLTGHFIQKHGSLPLSLMWYALEDGGMEYLPSQIAPSWSCLKGIGPVGFHDCRGATPTTRIDNIGTQSKSLLLRGRLREAKIAMPNGEIPVTKPTYFSMSFTNKTQYGTFTNTLGPARFDSADAVPKDFVLLLVFEKMPYRNYTNSQKDQLALILQEVSTPEAANRSEFAGKEGVKRYERIGIANVNNHAFFQNAPFSELVII